MTRRLNAEGGLEESIRQVLADLGDGDEEKIRVSLDVPGFDLDDLGDVHLTLEVPEALEDDDEDDDEDENDEDENDEDENDEDENDEDEAGVSLDELDEEADAAADFLEGILDAMQLPGDIQIRVHEDRAEVEVVNVGSGRLIGRRGQTLDAIQELARCALQRQFERRTRVVVDVEGYRSRRLEKMLEKAKDAIDEVLDTGEPQRLEPMDVYERKAVHHLVAEHEGVTSGSRGREPTRRVVIERA
jgi:spoIIIJ-associated protein